MYAVVIASPAEAPPRSLSQYGADRQARLGSELRGGNLLAVLILHLGYLDLAALRRDEQTLGTDGGHRSDATRDLREPAEQMLARVEQLQRLAAEAGPRAGG